MSFVDFGLLLLLIFCEIIIYKLDKHSRKLVFLSTILLFVPFYLVILYFDSFSIQRYLVFDTFSLSTLSYMIFIISIVGFVIASIIMNIVSVEEVKAKKVYSIKIINVSFYLTAFISITAFLVNLNRVGGIGGVSLLFEEPRLYEITFGSNTFSNYFYFLNVPALIFLLKKIELTNAKFIDLFIGSVLVLISFFHGIKFTIFDTILFTFIYYLFNSEKINLRKLVLVYSFIFLSLVTIYILFSEMVRGSRSDLILTFTSYIYPNVINALYAIEVQPLAFNFIRSIWPSVIPYILDRLH